MTRKCIICDCKSYNNSNSAISIDIIRYHNDSFYSNFGILIQIFFVEIFFQNKTLYIPGDKVTKWLIPIPGRECSSSSDCGQADPATLLTTSQLKLAGRLSPHALPPTMGQSIDLDQLFTITFPSWWSSWNILYISITITQFF